MRRFISHLFAFPEWVFGRRAAGLDLGFGAMAAGWFSLMIGKPAMFDRGSFVGMDWLPDSVWIGILGFLVLTHLAGLACPRWKSVRVPALLMSAWLWILISISLNRVELGTGVVVYGIAGCGALVGALFVAGLPREKA